MTNTTKMKMDALENAVRHLGRVSDRCDEDQSLSIDPRDRVRVCDVDSRTADEYEERKLAEAERALERAGLGGARVYIGEKGHIEFSIGHL